MTLHELKEAVFARQDEMHEFDSLRLLLLHNNQPHEDEEATTFTNNIAGAQLRGLKSMWAAGEGGRGCWKNWFMSLYICDLLTLHSDLTISTSAQFCQICAVSSQSLQSASAT